MGSVSKIEWTDSTWNPIRARNLATGKIGWHCEHASEGCRFCYAEGMNRRLGTGLDFKPGHRADVEIFLDEKMLLAPLRWKKPWRIFVNSMSDTFAEFVKDEWIDRMFAVMALCPQHIFQVLTKRPWRMREYLCAGERKCLDVHPQEDRELAIDRAMNDIAPAHWCKRELMNYAEDGLPLPNVWLGISAERQQEADERIPDLLATPAAVRFVSLEPLLGPIDLATRDTEVGDISWLRGFKGSDPPIAKLDWVIVGGESGLHARPMSIQWVRELRDQCVSAGAPFFFKQFGEWAPAALHHAGDAGRFAFGDYEHDRATMVQVDGYPRQFTMFGARSMMMRIGKKAAGRLLDGIEHNGMPS